MDANYNSRDKKSKSTKQYQPEFPLVYDSRTGPYSTITDKIDSLGRNLVNLLMTNPGEWPMNPDLGIGIRRYLFEQSTSNISQSLKPKIVKQLSQYLPHVKLHSIKIEQSENDIDNNSIKIRINCVIMTTSFASIVAYLDKLTKLVVDYKKIKQNTENNLSLVPGLGSDLVSKQVVL